MANKILVARGTKARIEEIKSTLATNELVYSTDTGELGVKKANGDIEYFKNAADINAIVDDKVDKVSGKGLSTNDFTNNDKNKLDGIEAGAEVNVQSDWNATSGDALILNKPIIPTKVSELINDKNYVDENYVNSKLTAVYKFKGSVANYAALPTTDLTIGDVYDVQDTGMNYAWNGSDWDSLGIVIDLSNYYQKNETFTQNEINSMLDDKVDKVTGKGLSTNDFTTTEKNKLSGIQAGAQVNAVTTVAGRTGAVVLAKADVGLGSVQNYAIASKTQAEAGTSNVLYMTPLRTKEAITAAMGDIESALDAILGV